MPFQRVPNTVLISIIGSLAGEVVENTFYGQMDGGYELADLENLASDVDAWVASSWLPILNGAYTYLRTVVHGLNAAIDLEAVDATSTGNGALDEPVQANNVSLACKRKSAYTGRGARGRIYFPCISESQLEADNVVTAAFQAALLAALTALDGVITDAGFVPVIVHRVASGVPLTEAVVYSIVEWVIVNGVVDSMRRRLPGRGV